MIDYYVWLQTKYVDIKQLDLKHSEIHYKSTNDKTHEFCPLIYIASYKDLYDSCIPKPEQFQDDLLWLTYIGNWHYNNFGKNEIKSGKRPCVVFDSWSYIAGYPETKDLFWNKDINTLNKSAAAHAWIVYGNTNNLKKNKYDLNPELSKILLSDNSFFNSPYIENNIQICKILFKKRILIFGNSVQKRKECKNFNIHKDDVIIRFNKAFMYEKKTDILICNSSIINKYFTEISQLTNNFFCFQYGGDNKNILKLQTHMSINQSEAFTSGALFLNFIVHNTAKCYSEVYIAGFNMVDGGNKAHYFDNEKVPLSSTSFPGHNAQNERKFIEELVSKKSNKVFKM